LTAQHWSVARYPRHQITGLQNLYYRQNPHIVISWSPTVLAYCELSSFSCHSFHIATSQLPREHEIFGEELALLRADNSLVLSNYVPEY